MTEERMKDMIHETLKSGRGITEAKGPNQELIVNLMSSKGNLGNVFLFHTYMVVSRTKIKFGKVSSTTQFIQKLINDKNDKFSFDCEFVEDTKIKTHAPRPLFLEYHDYQRRIGAGTMKDNTWNLLLTILEQFSQFHFLEKWMMIRVNIGRKIAWY
jgi:hypothetical protein